MQVQLDRDFAPTYFVSADLQATRFPILPMEGLTPSGIPFAKVIASAGNAIKLITLLRALTRF